MPPEDTDQELQEIPDRMSGEALEEAAKNFFASLDEDESESDPKETEETEEESPSVDDEQSPDGGDGSGEGSDSSPLSSPLPDILDFGDKGKVSRAEVENLLAFQAFVQANPAVAQQIAAVVEGADSDTIANPKAPTTTPDGKPYSEKVPEGLDLEDPAIAALWNEHLEVRRRLDSLQPQVDFATKTLNTQQAEQAGVFLSRVRDSFAKEHDLTPEDVARVQEIAGRMNILPALMAPIDPLTGLPRKVDPLSAIESAFKSAYAIMPEFEAKRLAKVNEQTRKDITKKKKLSSLAGSSGSVPKSQSQREPKNAVERRNAMIAEVAQSMFGNNTDK